MDEITISKLLRLTLIVDIISGIYLGIMLLFFADLYVTIMNWPYFDPLLEHLLGVAMFTFTFGSCWAYKKAEWDKIKIIIALNIFWLFIGSIVIIISQFLYTLPISNWINISTFLILLIGFSCSYIQHEKSK